MTRNVAYSTISAGSAALMLVLLAAAGQWLGVADYGDFVWAINLATVAEVFMDFGLHQVTIRAIARDRESAGRLFRTSLVLKVLPGVGMVLVFGAIAFGMRAEPVVRTAAVLMLLSGVMRSYVLTARGILQGLERFGHDALVTVLDRLLLVVCCVAALWLGAGVIAVSVVFLVVRIVTAAIALLVARRHAGGGTFDRELWRTLPGEALPIGVFLLVLNLYNRIDTLMLGRMVGARDTGLYGSAYPIYEGLTYATAIVSALLVPRLSRLWIADRRAYSRLAGLSMGGTGLLGLLVAVVAWPLAEPGIVVVFGQSFAPAATALRWLLLGLPCIYIIWVLHAVAISAERTRVLLWVTSAGTLLNVGLNLLLIPRYSYDGAAAATVVSELVALALLAWGLRDALRSPAVVVSGPGDETGTGAPTVPPSAPRSSS